MLLLLILIPVFFASICFIIHQRFIQHLMLILGSAATLTTSMIAYFHPSFFTSFDLIALSNESIYMSITLSGIFTIAALYYSFQNIIDPPPKESIIDQKESAHNHTVFTMISLVVLSINILLTMAQSWFLMLSCIFLDIAMLSILFSLFQKPNKTHVLFRFLFVSAIACAFISLGILLIQPIFPNCVPNEIIEIENYIHYMNIGFIFIIIGFGVFVGVAPIHAWVPVVTLHPMPATTLILFSSLFNLGVWGFIRINALNNALPYPTLFAPAMLNFGLATLLLGAFFAVIQLTYTRLITYIIIAQTGLTLVIFGLTPKGMVEPFMQLIIWILMSGAMLYLVAGNIQRIILTTKSVTADLLFKRAPITTIFWLTGLLVICVFPPFGVFNAIEYVIQRCFMTHSYVTLSIIVIGEIVLFAAATAHLLSMIKKPNIRATLPIQSIRESYLMIIPPCLIFITMIYGAVSSENILGKIIQHIIQSNPWRGNL